VGAPTTDQGGHNAGAAYIVFGRNTGFAANLAIGALGGTNGFTLSGEEQADWTGASVSRAGDVNGDGFDDFMIGARFAGGGFLVIGDSPGAAYVVFGKASGFASEVALASLNGENGYKLTSTEGGDFVGFAVADAGDVNGDGFDDIIVGARDDAANNAAADVVFGRATGFEPVLHASELDGANGFRLASQAFSQFGVSVGGAGDVNDDGFDDMVVGASTADSAGAAFVIFGKRDGWSVETDLDALHGANGFKLSGIASDDRTGFAVGNAGDFNGDGFSDILVGAPSADPAGGYSGQAYVVFGKAFGFAPDVDLASLDGRSGFLIPGQSAGDQAGFSVSAAGDLNNDGIDDLIVSAPGDDGNSVRAGSAYVLFGGDDSNFDLSRLDGSLGFKLAGTAAGDQAGFAVSVLGDVNGDGFDDVAIGAFGADAGSEDAGAAYVVFGRAGGFTATSALSDLNGTTGFKLSGLAASDFAGRSVNAAGDVNGDGLADFIVGVPKADAGGIDAGAAYVVFGRDSGFTAVFDPDTLDGTTGFTMVGSGTGDMTGEAVSSAGDINGDGYDDFILGAPYADTNGADAGAAYVVFGKASPFAADIAVSALDGNNGLRIYGFAAGDYGGRAVAGAGDVNGDGLDDIVVGAWGTDVAGNNDGVSYVIFGKRTGFAADMDLATLDGVTGFKLIGTAADRVGFSVAPAGDVNGDGYADVIIGASAGNGGGTNSGTAHIVFGKASGFAASIELSILDGTNGFRLDGIEEGDNAGHAVAGAGDVNGDGYDDVLVGALNAEATGAAYLVYGKASAFAPMLDLAALDGTNGFKLSGTDNGDDTGRSVSGGGDVNGDGFDDIMIGANLADPNGSASGAAYVFFGADFTAAAARLGTSGPDVLAGTPGAESIIGKQGNDLLVGNGGADVILGGAGNDRIEVPDLAFRRIDGDRGFDVLALNGAGITLDLSAFADRIRAIEQIDLSGAGNNTLLLRGHDVLQLSSTSNQLRILGNAGDVLITRDWTYFGDVSGGSDVFRIYTQGAATLLVDTDVVVANAVIQLGSLAGADGTRFDGVAPGDAAGTSARSAGDVNGDGFDDFIVGAPLADPNGEGSGSAYLVFGRAIPYGSQFPLSILDGLIGVRLAGAASDDAAGYSVAAAGDINGDGHDDVVVGAPRRGCRQREHWRWLHPVRQSRRFPRVVRSGHARWSRRVPAYRIGGERPSRYLRRWRGRRQRRRNRRFHRRRPRLRCNAQRCRCRLRGIRARRCVRADSGPQRTRRRERFQTARRRHGRSRGQRGCPRRGCQRRWYRRYSGGRPYRQRYVPGAGAAYIVFGRSTGSPADIDLGALDGSNGLRVSGLAAGDETGFALAAAGDVNGDGFDDVIVGAFGSDADGADAGTTFLVFGKGTPFTGMLDLGTLDGTNGLRFAATAGATSGISVRGVGDANGDGYADLLVGASGMTAGAGAAYLVYGKPSGFAATVTLDTLDGRDGFRLAGGAANDAAGQSVSAAGDVNGDGFDDVLIGAPSADAGGADAGAIYLVYGGNFSGAVTRAGTSGDDALVGTFDADAMIGGTGNDNPERSGRPGSFARQQRR
jgi:hypothetical protein